MNHYVSNKNGFLISFMNPLDMILQMLVKYPHSSGLIVNLASLWFNSLECTTGFEPGAGVGHFLHFEIKHREL